MAPITYATAKGPHYKASNFLILILIFHLFHFALFSISGSVQLQEQHEAIWSGRSRPSQQNRRVIHRRKSQEEVHGRHHLRE